MKKQYIHSLHFMNNDNIMKLLTSSRALEAIETVNYIHTKVTMDVSSFVLEQALKQLNVPAYAIKQLQIAGKLSNVEGKGFPQDLFELSAPMVTRGLLNFAILQMKRDWIYPHWIHKQLDPSSPSFIPRSQNPLLLNLTHRNWTLIGSAHGFYEAIVDPCGLLTPLPREWSVDVWIATEENVYYPSLMPFPEQQYNTIAPRITTIFDLQDFELSIDAFVDTINNNRDVAFEEVRLTNKSTKSLKALIGIAVRPFNPEGVAPIQHIEYREPRSLYVNHTIGIVFAKKPEGCFFSSYETDDTSTAFKNFFSQQKEGIIPYQTHSSCKYGLANAVALYPVTLEPFEETSVNFSIALGTEQELKNTPVKTGWRVSYAKRLQHHIETWQRERSKGAVVEIPDQHVKQLLSVNTLFLLQLHDRELISPGPYLYHRFWFRDAVPMTYALERLGFHTHAHELIDSFHKRQTSDGFFKAPDGEWDSNGAVLWFFNKHYALYPKTSWLEHLFPIVKKAVNWIIQKRAQSRTHGTTHAGLMPPSISAEHFGTVDQYYWDSFWSLAGLRAAINIAKILHKQPELFSWEEEALSFSKDIRTSLQHVAERLQQPLIPASPSRNFDETAIGFVAGIYPLQITDIFPQAFSNSLNTFVQRYVTPHGYYHPIIHSGYNAYLTLHLAHAYLIMNNTEKAWDIANTILQHCRSPYSFPEAIHPRTHGGSMGDGHHGWAAAEIVLFLLDCMVYEEENSLKLFQHKPSIFIQWGSETRIEHFPTSFGTLFLRFSYQSPQKAFCEINLQTSSHKKLQCIDLYLPYSIQRILPTNPNVKTELFSSDYGTHIRLYTTNVTLLLER